MNIHSYCVLREPSSVKGIFFHSMLNFPGMRQFLNLIVHESPVFNEAKL